MNPDVFITIAFGGLVLLLALLSLAVVVPQVRREMTGIRQRERAPDATSATPRTRGKADDHAAVH